MASRRAKAREFRGAAPGGKTHGVRDVRLGRVDRPHLLRGATECGAEADGGGRGPGEHGVALKFKFKLWRSSGSDNGGGSQVRR